MLQPIVKAEPAENLIERRLGQNLQLGDQSHTRARAGRVIKSAKLARINDGWRKLAPRLGAERTN